jgi:succinoglycan biosynthesis protein ExoV
MKVNVELVPGRNFGDDLNGWLWPRILPEVFDDDERVLFVGISSAISRLHFKLAKKRRLVVFGAGAGYGGRLLFSAGREFPWKTQQVGAQLAKSAGSIKLLKGERVRIYCIRGPLTARLMKLDEGLAISDAGMLIRKVVAERAEEAREVSVMMHHRTTAGTDFFKDACKELSFQYIDPAEPIEDVLEKLRNSKMLISEALHGAIVADALRVPWVPIVSSSIVLRFKWEDFCMSMGLPYRPHAILPMWDYHRFMEAYGDRVPRLQRPLGRARMWWENNKNRDEALQSLLMASAEPPFLSDDRRLATVMDRFDEKLEQLRHDAAHDEWMAGAS